MGPKKDKTMEENIEDIVKRVVSEAWKDQSMLDSLANLMRNSIVAELKATIDKNTQVIQEMQQALVSKDKKIAELEIKLMEKQDDLEQYQRRQSVRIFGVKEEENENTDDLVMDVANKIGVQLALQDIDRCHRVGRRGDKPRAIIAKFVSYRRRSEVFRNKRQLKGTGVTIREDLTKTRHNLLKMCISKYGVHNCWTLDGIIHVKQGDTKLRISRAADINCES